MTCRRFQDQIILFIYNELSAREQKRLDKHLAQCSGCREFLKENQQMISGFSKEAQPGFSPDWDGYWNRIAVHLNEPEHEKRNWFPFPSKAFSFGMSALVLIAGIIIGRFFLSSPKSMENRPLMDKTNTQFLLVSAYFEDIKPVMLDYANYDIPDQNGNGGPVDRDIIRRMLDETRLLRRHISPRRDPYLSALLEDLEMILTEIKNSSPDGGSSLVSLQGMIREKRIPLKIDLFNNKAKRSEKL